MGYCVNTSPFPNLSDESANTILDLMSQNTKIGIVTAAGYTEAEKYYGRLHGLLEAIKASIVLTDAQKQNLVVMGGESNFLFAYSLTSPFLLTHLPRRSWILPSMSTWTQPTITSLLDLAESSLRECIANLALPATILRKERAVGIIPSVPGYKFDRESLEETVLVVQKKLEMTEVGRSIPFCAFNGGNDVFVDIGDKSWGVLVCQEYFGRTSTSGKSFSIFRPSMSMLMLNRRRARTYQYPRRQNTACRRSVPQRRQQRLQSSSRRNHGVDRESNGDG